MYQLDIHPQKMITETAPSLYGIFFEDINRAGDGGLYAELLKNRAFEEGVLPERCTYHPESKTITSPTGWVTSFECYEGESIIGWEAKDGAEMHLLKENTLNPSRLRAMEIRFHGGCVQNCGYSGIPIEAGKQYRFMMFAKAEGNICLSVRLVSSNGEIVSETDISNRFALTDEYAQYSCLLTATADDTDAKLEFHADGDAAVILGFTSLFPVDTYKGRENGLRKSLVERLQNLHPAFMRFPGGCIVEGFSRETAFRFADTVGPIWERKSHWLLWNYRTTNGLGFHEYLQLCEDLGMDAMYVFNCGMSCQGRMPDYFDEALIHEFYEDTLHAIAYATDAADTKWGAMRAKNGHPEPFTVLKYIEIGNENWGSEYEKRYRIFYQELKEKYPQFIYLSNTHTEKAGLPTEYVDEHFYAHPTFFAANTAIYDNYDRENPLIYCGEYASTIGCKKGTLYGALGEAAFLTGIERNQDIVRMTSYAPLFQNVDAVAWEPDLIVFNNHDDYVIPSYYMLQMFAANRGDYVCEYTLKTKTERQHPTGAFTRDGELLPSEPDRCMGSFEGGNVSIRFWDNQISGEDQNYYDWIFENGCSRVVHQNGWSSEELCRQQLGRNFSGNQQYEIHTVGDTFQIFLNGELLHDVKLAEIPDLSGVCTVDRASGEIITKLVNFSEKEIELCINNHANMQKEAVLITLTGVSYDAQNSFEQKEAVKTVTNKIQAEQNFTLALPPRSIHVLRQKVSEMCM